jgi:rifampicin phosphotransferase
VFQKRLRKAGVLMQIREDTHFYATMSLPLFRRVSLEFGRRLIEAGVLDQREDVFHLTLGELAGIDDSLRPASATANELRAAVARRKEKRKKLESTPLVDARLFPKSVARGDAVVTGTPGSPGVAEGTARVVHNDSEFGKLTPGDVLVAPYTNPSWTPLFERAVAVVVDTGSVGSHAAIVAREYGIPAVMGTGEGTRKLRDGDPVKVDGTQGYVFLRERA